MKFENTEVTGFENAILGARLPMCKDLQEAKEKSDSFICVNGSGNCEKCRFNTHDIENFEMNEGCLKEEILDEYKGVSVIGEKDLDLLKQLINADDKIGQPNSKFLRMIHAQVCITAPLYWWKEMDTYKVGTTANSTSTMHRIANYPITMDCFEMDDFAELVMIEDSSEDRNDVGMNCLWDNLIYCLEQLRQGYNELINQAKDLTRKAKELEESDINTSNEFKIDAKKASDVAKKYWKELIRLLPESWLQTRMFDCDYATLRNIYCWRVKIPHKLTEWKQFGDWVETLPYAKELIIN